jgi:23S rRNA U2552 (ribose-2'-O)-methylase RlmE/FtsJ
MMCQIGRELHDKTSAFTPKSAINRAIRVLDVCMAPGGFSSAVLAVHHHARISAITLPKALSGHDILLHDWRKDRRVEVRFVDVTMLAAEMGTLAILSDHPDVLSFSLDRPFSHQEFDLIFCDGQVLRTHQRAGYREKREAWRLLTSQLVVSLQRIAQGGTVVVLLHKLDAWDTIVLLHQLSRFSTLELFKPVKKHAVKSSFYVVAKNVQSHCTELNIAVEDWKKEWHVATFGTDAEYVENRHNNDNTVWDVLEIFGDQLVMLGEPIWRIQSDALLNAPFMK